MPPCLGTPPTYVLGCNQETLMPTRSDTAHPRSPLSRPGASRSSSMAGCRIRCPPCVACAALPLSAEAQARAVARARHRVRRVKTTICLPPAAAAVTRHACSYHTACMLLSRGIHAPIIPLRAMAPFANAQRGVDVGGGRGSREGERGRLKSACRGRRVAKW